MFGRNSQSIYSSSSPYSSNPYSSGSGYRSPSYQDRPKFGSYRVRDYDSEKLYEVLSKVQQYKDYTPNSISIRDETIHLSPIEIRAQDYHLIRTKALDDKYKRTLESCIDKKSFNKQLLSDDSIIGICEPLSFNQLPLPPEAIQKVCNGTVGRYGSSMGSPFGNYGNGGGNTGSGGGNMFTGGNSGNMYGSTSNNSSNPFASNNSYNARNSSNTNIFTGNNNGTNTGVNNMFASRTGTGNNMLGSGTNSNRNLFAGSNGTSNVSGNTGGNNPFASNSGGGSNPFASNNGGSGGNMFASNSGNNMMGSNRFGNNSSNPFTSNNNNTGSGSNMFANNNNSNPFTNNNNNYNNNSGNNMFNSNNNNRNPFSSNNNGGGGSGNNLFNNGGGNSGSNMFSNNNSYGNNSNRGNNLFANNNGSSGNNLFNNNNNNLFNNNNGNGGYGNNNNNGGGMGYFNEYAMLQMAHILKQCADRVFNNNNTTPNSNTTNTMNSMGNSLMGTGSLLGMTMYQDPNTNSLTNNMFANNNNNSDYFKNSERMEKRYAQWFRDPFDGQENAIGYSRRRKYNDSNNGNNTKTIVIVKEGSSNVGNNGSFIKNGTGGVLPHYDNLWEGEQVKQEPKNTNDTISMSQYNKFYTSKPVTTPSPPEANSNNPLYQPTQNNSGIKRTSSSFRMDFNTNNNNPQPSQYHTVKSLHKSKQKQKSKQPDSIYGSNMKAKMSTSNVMNGIRYRYQICCIWGESLRRKDGDGFDGLGNGDGDDREEFLVQGELMLNCNPSMLELNEVIFEDMLNRASQNGFTIRKDANLTLQLPHPLSKQQYLVRGSLVQNRINIPRGYDYIYDNLTGWQVTNLTIANKMGRVLWPGTISIREVNFEKDVNIMKNMVDIDGPLEWEYDKVVTLNSLPRKVEGELPDQRKARLQMEREIKAAKKGIGNQGIQLIELDLKNKFYTIRIDKFPKNGQSNVNVQANE